MWQANRRGPECFAKERSGLAVLWARGEVFRGFRQESADASDAPTFSNAERMCRTYGASRTLYASYPGLTPWANFCRAYGAG